MNKLVYLFELDSVRNSKAEIEIAQKMLYRELIEKGNTVVLSYNQLVDSEAFLIALKKVCTSGIISKKNKEKNYYADIVELFKIGVLKYSRFGSINTPSQYIQNSLKKNLNNKENKSVYFFSGIPVKPAEVQLQQIILSALQYSDMELLTNFIDNEIQLKKDYSDLNLGKENDKISDYIERLKYIESYIKLISSISQENMASNPAKRGNLQDFCYFMHLVIDEFIKNPCELDIDMTDHCKREVFVYLKKVHVRLMISNIHNWEDFMNQKTLYSLGFDDKNNFKINDRSYWLNYIIKNNYFNNIDQLNLCKAVIHLCYNYAVEASIANVDNRWFCNNFIQDFIYKMKEYWSGYRNGIHKFDTYEHENIFQYSIKLPPWDSAARVLKLIDNHRMNYKKSWIKVRWKVVIIELIKVLVFLIIVVIGNHLLETFINLTFLKNLIIYIFASSFMLGYFIPKTLAKFKFNMDIMEAYKSLITYIKDILIICFFHYKLY